MPKRLSKLSRWTALDKKIIFSVTVFIICLLSWIAYANAFNSMKLQDLRIEVKILEHEMAAKGESYGSMGSTEKQPF